MCGARSGPEHNSPDCEGKLVSDEAGDHRPTTKDASCDAVIHASRRCRTHWASCSCGKRFAVRHSCVDPNALENSRRDANDHLRSRIPRQHLPVVPPPQLVLLIQARCQKAFREWGNGNPAMLVQSIAEALLPLFAARERAAAEKGWAEGQRAGATAARNQLSAPLNPYETPS